MLLWAASAAPVAAAPIGKIAFVRDGDIWIMDSDGGGQRQLTNYGDAHSPFWSPDSNHIVFFKKSQLMFYDLQSGRSKEIASIRTNNSSLSWGTDNAIIFIYNISGNATVPSGLSRLAFDWTTGAPATENFLDVKMGALAVSRALLENLKTIRSFLLNP